MGIDLWSVTFNYQKGQPNMLEKEDVEKGEEKGLKKLAITLDKNVGLHFGQHLLPISTFRGLLLCLLLLNKI